MKCILSLDLRIIKVWIWIAVDKNTGLIIAHKTGDRSNKSPKKLLKEIPKKVLDKCIFYTDKWKAYNILPNERHKMVRNT
ncbi:IS1 family transposase [Methanocaldococcus infernus]|uniref:IS1 family transposase n=1 Tax=Methanocaldococcus infernus TaxID=67760 RepID=UPI0012F6E400